jgi:hypothetical protein
MVGNARWYVSGGEQRMMSSELNGWLDGWMVGKECWSWVGM